jgi:hypothetical protein
MMANGSALSCGTDNFQFAENETSSLYQLSIKHKTYVRHEFRTQLATVSLSAWLGSKTNKEKYTLLTPFSWTIISSYCAHILLLQKRLEIQMIGV